MILTTAVLSLTLLGQGEFPGSRLSLERAKDEARFIVVAEVGKTGDCLNSPDRSILIWAELKPSAMLKGAVTGEELNKHPLAILALGNETLPKTGDELVFFIGDRNRDFNISKVLPKTKAILAAVKAETPPSRPRQEKGDPDQGSIPDGGGHPVIKPDAPPAYRGTKIVPEPKAVDDMLKLQNEFAAAMSRADPKPEDRRAHFAWLDKNECVRRYGVSQIGWYGAVSGCEPRPGGGWSVKVVIRPWLYSMSLKTLVVDSVEETYEFVRGRVRLVKSNAAQAKPTLQHFSIVF